MSLANYLAKNYGSADKDKKKKSKEKKSGGIVVIDDGTLPAMKKVRKSTGNTSAAIETQPPPVREHPVSSGSKGWKVVGTNELISEVAGTEASEGPKMASGARAGLQTGAQVAAQIKEKEERDKEKLRTMYMEGQELASETIHRDASGAKIDMKTRLEERKRRRDVEELEKERKKRDMNMGLVQKLQREEQRLKLERAGSSGLTRYADDKDLNQAQKQREMEDDPMMSFKPEKSKKYVSLTGRKIYRGPFPENRFGIAPGHRWDGVDRSNGFEKKFFKQQVENERVKKLSYTMQEDY